ncbi:hypothetical protein AZI86_03595 [Bdellovibrio bacteriovorus]|uniref:Organic solvent tolerance protein n=1 Tax=Bdellovibrio bacteriovorus TaxID=959 RepID=A0A150WP34_BDEBC|nr:hypothetical protein [Bdellovibrio bacteriovorus]KYG66158.1 hypothetical protein AZI86_03595 [Bdellovibrio bacteriovorus]
MRLIFFFALSVLVSLCSFLSEARADVVRGYLLNSEMRYERASNQDMVNRSPMNYAISYQRSRFSVLLEHVYFTETSGNPTSAFERQHAEYLAWFRLHALAWTFGDNTHTVQLYGGLAAGAYQETVTTVFMGTSRVDTGRWTFMTGLSGGVEYSVKLTPAFLIVAAAEGRGFTGSDLDPNPMWSAVFRLGVGLIF